MPKKKRDRIKRDLDQATAAIDKALEYIGRAAKHYEEPHPDLYDALLGFGQIIKMGRDGVQQFRDVI